MHNKVYCNYMTHQLCADSTKKHVVFLTYKYTFIVTAGYKVNYRMGWGDGGIRGITPPNP